MTKYRLFFMLLMVMLIAAAGTGVLAQSSSRFDLSWHAIGIGGGQSSSASFQVDGAIGQIEPTSFSSASYQMTSGFWQDFSSDNIVYLIWLTFQ